MKASLHAVRGRCKKKRQTVCLQVLEKQGVRGRQFFTPLTPYGQKTLRIIVCLPCIPLTPIKSIPGVVIYKICLVTQLPPFSTGKWGNNCMSRILEIVIGIERKTAPLLAHTVFTILPRGHGKKKKIARASRVNEFVFIYIYIILLLYIIIKYIYYKENQYINQAHSSTLSFLSPLSFGE